MVCLSSRYVLKYQFSYLSNVFNSESRTLRKTCLKALQPLQEGMPLSRRSSLIDFRRLKDWADHHGTTYWLWMSHSIVNLVPWLLIN